ncbi:unnamed protein product [Cunninghamella blakesleeana]
MINTRHTISLLYRKALNTQIYNNQKRCFIVSRSLLQTDTIGKSDNNTFEPNPSQFPWLLSNSPPRIKEYPYIKAPSDWGFLNILPIKLQHALCRWLGYRMLQLNMGENYFPDQFLLGASLGTRKTLESISKFLTEPSEATIEEVNQLISPTLAKSLLGKAEGAFAIHDEINISLPQIYDVTVGDIWVTLGNKDALKQPKKFETLKWMTLMVALRRFDLNSESEEPFSEFRKRVGQGLMEGAHIAIDVEIDADVRYQILRPIHHSDIPSSSSPVLNDHQQDNNNNKEIILFDEGRRNLLVRFESPYFVPASTMVSGRDQYTGEPINDWSFRIADIDQLVEKQQLDNGLNDNGNDDDDDDD